MSIGLEVIGLQSLGLDAGSSGVGSSDPVIVDVTATDTTAVVTYTGVATHYRLDGGSSVSIGASPHTITGLTANTEYDIEITADEVTWTDVYPFGTDNSAGGGGGIPWATSGTLAASESGVDVALFSGTVDNGAAPINDSSVLGLSRPVFGMRSGRRVLLKRIRPAV